MKKKIIVLLICIVFCLVAVPIVVYAFATPAGSALNINNVSGVTNAGVVLPQLGEDYVSEEFQMPDSNSLQKEWYEFIEFESDYTDYQEEMSTIRCYFPTDYSTSTVMTYKPLQFYLNSGAILVRDEEIQSTTDYTTATSITVSYSISRGESRNFLAGLELGTEGGLIGVLDKIKVEETISDSTSKNKTLTRTFEKKEGINAPWRIVQYYVQVPIKVEVLKGTSVIDHGYFLINTITGTCRQWADGTIEHWQNGERVTIENFESDFCTPDSIRNRSRQDWN